MVSLLLSLLLAGSAPAEPRWVKLFDEPDESTFIQSSAPRRAEPELMLWIKHDYRRPRPGGVRSLRDQWLFNCSLRSFTMFAMVSYDARGEVLRAQALPASERRAAPVIPGSRMERVFSAVCG